MTLREGGWTRGGRLTRGAAVPVVLMFAGLLALIQVPGAVADLAGEWAERREQWARYVTLDGRVQKWPGANYAVAGTAPGHGEVTVRVGGPDFRPGDRLVLLVGRAEPAEYLLPRDHADPATAARRLLGQLAFGGGLAVLATWLYRRSRSTSGRSARRRHR